MASYGHVISAMWLNQWQSTQTWEWFANTPFDTGDDWGMVLVLFYHWGMIYLFILDILVLPAWKPQHVPMLG